MRAVGSHSVFSDVVRSRELLLSLAWRDVRVRYKQSVLGVGWAVLLPVSMMVVFTFVFTRAIDARSVLNLDIPYALYAYVGLVPWTFFSGSLAACVGSLVSNRNLVTKVYFPREVFPLSCVASALVDFCIASIVLVALMFYFGWQGPWRFVAHPALALLPAILLIQIALTVGIGMALAMANLFYRDVRQIFGAGIQLLMFVSCVVVPVPRDGSVLAIVLSLNPMVWIIQSYRDCVLEGRWPHAGGLAYAATIAGIALVVGWTVFRRAAHRFAECI
ncbi:MAG: ABC transporter permease [Phycisphaerae bacterium]